MGRRVNNRGRNRGEARHVRLYAWFTNSPAWQSLSPHARCLYLEIKQRFDSRNNGTIPMSVREARASLHCSQDTATRAFKELESLGFIIQTLKGSFGQKLRVASEWIITEEAVGEKLATKDFMKLIEVVDIRKQLKARTVTSNAAFGWKKEGSKKNHRYPMQSQPVPHADTVDSVTVPDAVTNGTQCSNREAQNEPIHGTQCSNTYSIPRGTRLSSAPNAGEGGGAAPSTSLQDLARAFGDEEAGWNTVMDLSEDRLLGLRFLADEGGLNAGEIAKARQEAARNATISETCQASQEQSA